VLENPGQDGSTPTAEVSPRLLQIVGVVFYTEKIGAMENLVRKRRSPSLSRTGGKWVSHSPATVYYPGLAIGIVLAVIILHRLGVLL
jgi:hypothetical protein